MICAAGAARVLHVDDVIEGLVALVARVVGRAKPDEAPLALEDEQRSVDDGHEEAFLVGDRVADGVEAAVHARRHVATVARLQRDRAARQEVSHEEAGLGAAGNNYNLFKKMYSSFISIKKIN